MRQLATIQQIAEKKPIENADAIEAVRVNGWWCVAKKGEFEVGDPCVYFEIDSLLPAGNPAFEFMNKNGTKKVQLEDGRVVEGYRLKTIRLRGQLSQGLALPVTLFQEVADDDGLTVTLGRDVSDILGVYKYENAMQGNPPMHAKGFFPSFLHKTDEERIQNLPHVLQEWAGEPFFVTEKIDGSSCTFYKKDGEFGMCSRNLELKVEEGSHQWTIAQRYNLQERLPDGYAVQGELFGEGIQKNPLKMTGVHFRVYNVFDIADDRYLDYRDMVRFVENLGMETVPVLFEDFSLGELATTIDGALALAEGKSQYNEDAQREGIVFRPMTEKRADMRNRDIGRLSFKAISNSYLLKNE